MSYSAVPNNYDHGEIMEPPVAFPPPEQTQYSHEKKYPYAHVRSDSESQRPYTMREGPSSRKTIWKAIKFAAIQILAFCWIGPIVALLYLNMSQWIIGASAWCPFGRCRPYQYGSGGELDTYSYLAEFDKDSHDLLGALQFAAKALEIWFILVATALVFRVTMILVHMQDGLPIGYLYRSMEYAEVTSLLDRELYMTVLKMPGKPGKHIKKRVAAFVFMTIVLCIICNLMGPAVAVLLIPQLQWIDTDLVGNQTLTALNAGSPPSVSGFAYLQANPTNGVECTAAEFSAEQFSCTSTWKNSLDAWVSSYQGSQGTETAIFSVQDTSSFSYNATYLTYGDNVNETVVFVPSRQVIQDLVEDGNIMAGLDAVSPTADPDGTYAQYVRTVQTYVHRQGPILGAITNLYADFDESNIWWTIVGNNQYLRCYASYNMANTPLCDGTCSTTKSGNYTRCISVGTGWNDGYKNTNFAIGSRWYLDNESSFNGSSGVHFNVTVHASGRAAFLPNGTLPSGFSPSCLPRNGTVRAGTQCDWDSFFATGDARDVQYHSKNVTTWEIWSDPQEDTTPSFTTLAIDFSAYQAVADYSFDPSPYTNPMANIATSLSLNDESYLKNLTITAIDPAWTLATFGVDKGGVMDGNRPLGQYLSGYFTTLADHYTEANPLDRVLLGIEGPAFMPVVQLMSLIDYTTKEVDPKTVKEDPLHPLLHRYAHMNVWAYSTSSRTSHVGIAVTILGCIVVLAKVALSLAVRKEYPGPLQMLVAAMEHRYTGEFHGRDERDFAPVVIKLRPDEDMAGGLRFAKRD